MNQDQRICLDFSFDFNESYLSEGDGSNAKQLPEPYVKRRNRILTNYYYYHLGDSEESGVKVKYNEVKVSFLSYLLSRRGANLEYE